MDFCTTVVLSIFLFLLGLFYQLDSSVFLAVSDFSNLLRICKVLCKAWYQILRLDWAWVPIDEGLACSIFSGVKIRFGRTLAWWLQDLGHCVQSTLRGAWSPTSATSILTSCYMGGEKMYYHWHKELDIGHMHESCVAVSTLGCTMQYIMHYARLF